MNAENTIHSPVYKNHLKSRARSSVCFFPGTQKTSLSHKQKPLVCRLRHSVTVLQIERPVINDIFIDLSFHFRRDRICEVITGIHIYSRI